MESATARDLLNADYSFEEVMAALVPSLSCLYMHMTPSHPRYLSAYRHLPTLGISTKVQTRTARKSHPDAHYSNSQTKMARQHAVRAHLHGGMEVVWASLDDKAKIPLGLPGLPQAAVTRTRRVVVGDKEVVTALDHDFSPYHLTPSVALLCRPGQSFDVGEDDEGAGLNLDHDLASPSEFYRGLAFTTIKDSILQPSEPWRHAAEFLDVLRKANLRSTVEVSLDPVLDIRS